MNPVLAKNWEFLEESGLHDWNTFSESEDDEDRSRSPDGKVWSVL